MKGPASHSQTTRRSEFTSTPVPRYSGKSSWEQYRQVFEAIACSNGWDDVTMALQLLTHLDGDALNVALLVPESQRVLSGILMKSLSEHYGSPGRLAEYERQFRRAFRRPGDDPSVFAIELETLAGGRLRISTHQYSYSWCGRDSSPDKPSAPSADIVWDLILRCGT